MNKLTLLIILLCIALFACKNKERKSPAQPETPKALQDNSYPVSEIVSKGRYAEDILEELYREEVSNSAELKELDKSVAEIPVSNSDSAESFNSYNNKNENFYNAAKDHLNQVKDSALRQRMQAIITGSLTKYELQVGRHKDLVKVISNKTATMNDLYAAMKIAVTVPIIEKYQKQLPSAAPLSNQLKKIERSSKSLDSLIMKN